MATVKSDRTRTVFDGIRSALKMEVLVGIPDSSADRAPSPGEKNPPNNALVGYWNEFGVPEKNIPARPFLVPGVMSIQGEIVATLTQGIVGVLSKQSGAYDKALNAVGLMAQVAVKQQILNGTFAPLSDRTIEARARRRHADTGKLVGNAPNRDARAFLKLRGEGVPDEVLHDAGLAKPLLDTRSLIGSINYVIRIKGT